MVLFTDGQNNRGADLSEFEDWYRQQRDADTGIQQIPAFVVQFGEASESDMQDVADLTGGRVFDGSAGLSDAFRDIRGYQ